MTIKRWSQKDPTFSKTRTHCSMLVLTTIQGCGPCRNRSCFHQLRLLAKIKKLRFVSQPRDSLKYHQSATLPEEGNGDYFKKVLGQMKKMTL